MALNFAEKQQVVEELKGTLTDSELIVLVHYKGLSVAEITDLRAKAREAGAGFKVTKNSLTKLALKDTVFAHLSDKFTGPTAISYSQDPVAAAKTVVEFAKNNETLEIISGAMGEQELDVSSIKSLASLPSLDELRAKIISVIQTPATRLAGVTQAPAGQLARVIGAYGAKEEA